MGLPLAVYACRMCSLTQTCFLTYVHSQVCIQGSLGEGIFTGLPLMLSGMRKALEVMDWQSSPGQMYEVCQCD